MSAILETKDLVTNFYTYEGVVKALDRINIRVERGETFGLVGESGCGKSVAVRSIMRIIQQPGKIEGGQVLFYPDKNNPNKSEDLLLKTEKQMQALRGEAISMIFQEPDAALNPVMSIGEQVAESFLFHRKRQMCAKVLDDLTSRSKKHGLYHSILKGIYKIAAQNPDATLLKVMNRVMFLKWWKKPLEKEAILRSIEIIGQLGISNPEKIVTLYPHHLSGGMKQRIVIAMALACGPEILIADEATSNLDVTIQAQILDLLARLKKQSISSILLITHDLGVVAETCDRVGVMYAGTLCEAAPVNAIFENPLHPYTRALLDSVPRLHQDGKLASISGNVPNLVKPPSGCRFHPRCPKAMAICRKEKPPFNRHRTGQGDNHWVACHLYGPPS